MSTFRLFQKSIVMSMRSRKRFIAFAFMYTALIVWMSISLETAGNVLDSSWDFWVAVASSIILSVLYAFVITQTRRTEIATLKCIGYQNSEVRVIIMGEIIWVTLVAFMFVSEMLIHITAIRAYANYNIGGAIESFKPIIAVGNLLIVVSLFLFAQIAGILLAYRRVLKLRPIIALRVMK